jgi:hypothetical protein
MSKVPVKAVTLAERPDLQSTVDTLTTAGWPTFMMKDAVSKKYWSELGKIFGVFQTLLLREADERLIAVANSIPLFYEGDLNNLPDAGWDWALATGCEQRKQNISPNILSALQIFIDPEFRGMGVSTIMLSLMKLPAVELGFKHLIAPVRPPLKSLYPHVPMDEFITWKNRTGHSLDAWIRTHEKCGAKIISVCHRSFVVEAPISDWEMWTERSFHDTNQVVLPEALNPIEVDHASQTASYVEPNVWMLHPVEEEQTEDQA